MHLLRIVSGLTALVFLSATTLAGTIYVDQSNPNCPGSGTLGDPYCTIQLAIDNAVSGDVIEVAPGTYNESPKVNGLVLTIRGTQGRDVTTVQGDGTQPVFTATSDAELTIEGLTVTGGLGDGGAVRCSSCALTVTNSTLTGNFANNAGGAIYFAGSTGKKLTVTGSTISNNYAFGGGGAFFLLNGAGEIEDSLIQSNTATQGGAVASGADELLTITSSVIRNNSASVSGGFLFMNNAGGLTMTNSTVSGNTAGNGGAVIQSFNSLINGATSITNSTLTGNLGGVNPFTFFGSAQQTVTFTNAILWNHTSPLFYGGTPNVSFSDVEGGFPGSGNINADPKFLDAPNGDYRLAYDSPCIDAGFNFLPLPSTDIEGDARKVDGDSNGATTIDMGSDEFDVLWKVNLPAAGNYNFTAMNPPGQAGNIALLLLSLGDGSASGGIPIPLSGGQKIQLDPDQLFSSWLSSFLPIGTVALNTFPSTTSAIPSTPGFTVYYAGVMIDLGTGKIPIVTPTHSYVTQ